VQLRSTTAFNQLYRVEATDDIGSPSWTSSTNNVLGTGNSMLVIDPDAATHASRFYRVKQLP